jgi:hypothetical protein
MRSINLYILKFGSIAYFFYKSNRLGATELVGAGDQETEERRIEMQQVADRCDDGAPAASH